MELRRHKDIIAFKKSGTEPVAFHARNLEVAALSQEAWEAMSPTQIALAEPVFRTSAEEGLQNLEEWNQEQNPAVKSGRIEFGIRSLTLNVTQICNLHCTYCAAGGDGTFGDPQKKISVEKTLPQLQFFLQKLPAGSPFHITFLGGEPLLYPEAMELIADYVLAQAQEKSIRASFSVVTNGTLFSENALRILKKIKCTVTVSIDGPAEINDRTRPQRNGQGSTAKVVEGIRKLVANKTELGPLVLHAVFSKNNTEVVKSYEFLCSFDVNFYEFTYTVDPSDELSSQAYTEGMKSIAEIAYARGGEAALRKIALFDHYFSALDQQQQTENFCGAGKSFLMIDARNQVFTCPWEVGNKKDQVGDGASLDLEKLERLSQPLIEKNNCQNCWARFLCGGGCMFVHKRKTKSENQKDLNFCVRTRELIATTILFYKKSRITCEENS